MHPSRRALAVVLPLASFAASLPAQRGKPTLEWQAGTAALDYGAVQVGQHGLSELKVGDQWRLGMGDATRLSLQMPALVGDSWHSWSIRRTAQRRAPEGHVRAAVRGRQGPAHVVAARARRQGEVTAASAAAAGTIAGSG